MILNYFSYFCVADFGQQKLAYSKSLSSFSQSGSSGLVFLCKTPTKKSGLFSKIYRSVLKQFDCVGLTKTPINSKVALFCYLRFYAAILSNVVKLTTLKKQSHKVHFTVPEMAINLQKEHCQSASFLLSFSCESIEKMVKIWAFFALPLYKRDF